jgi:hypothetical protein
MKPSTVLAKFARILIVAVPAMIATGAQASGLTIDAYNGQYYAANWNLTSLGGGSYDFSYTFLDNGQAGGCGASCNNYEITGSLTGTATGATPGSPIDVTSVSNVELLDASSNVVYSSLGTNVYSYTGNGTTAQSDASYFPLGGAYVSLDGSAMNILLANGSAFNEYFYVIPWTNGNGGPGSVVIGEQFVNATPLPSTWTMLIAGFAGLGFFACRGSKKNGAAVVAA